MTKHPFANPETVMITGASSGIGEALACHYAAPGRRLFLTGRNPERLAAVTAACEKKEATVEAEALNVLDEDAMAQLIRRIDDSGGLDLVIANAGVSGGTGGPELTPYGAEANVQVRRIFDVNLTGVLNTILPARDVMAARGRGQIAIISSAAAFRGLPSAPAYSGSKAAVKTYGEGMRMELAPAGVGVTVICPGSVKSRMTDTNNSSMPFKMPASRAAKIIAGGLAKNKAQITFPWTTHMIVWLLSVLPRAWLDPHLARMPKKS